MIARVAWAQRCCDYLMKLSESKTPMICSLTLLSSLIHTPLSEFWYMNFTYHFLGKYNLPLTARMRLVINERSHMYHAVEISCQKNAEIVAALA